jgi:membrane associated rhomboid family serine protease
MCQVALLVINNQLEKNFGEGKLLLIFYLTSLIGMIYSCCLEKDENINYFGNQFGVFGLLGCIIAYFISNWSSLEIVLKGHLFHTVIFSAFQFLFLAIILISLINPTNVP